MRKEIKKQLQMIMDQAVKDNQIAGMNMMVIKDGQEEAYLQCGYADKANGKMIERGYHIPSFFHDETDYSGSGHDFI
ncbi:MAG: hypothetical protein ACLS61_16425 [Ruminococcus sp.]